MKASTLWLTPLRRPAGCVGSVGGLGSSSSTSPKMKRRSLMCSFSLLMVPLSCRVMASSPSGDSAGCWGSCCSSIRWIQWLCLRAKPRISL